MSAGGESGAQANLSQRRIWLMTPDGSAKQPLTADVGQREERPRWSADGQWLLFARQRSDATGLWLCRVDGSQQRQVVPRVTLPGSYYGFIDWSRVYDWRWI